MPFASMTEHEQIVLEKFHVGVSRCVDPHLLDCRVTIERGAEFFGAELMATIRGFIWAEKESLRHQEVFYPCDWWQAAKARWFPVWWLRRWPARYHRVVLDVRVLYPTLKRCFPGHQAVLSIQRKDIDDQVSG